MTCTPLLGLYFDACNDLDSNKIYRVEIFFEEIVIDGPLRGIKYYAIRVVFQVRGSQHIHSYLWVVNTLTKRNKNEYIRFVDHVINSTLPDEHENPDLFYSVETYQLHRHSETSRKYKYHNCRFHFGKFLPSTQ